MVNFLEYLAAMIINLVAVLFFDSDQSNIYLTVTCVGIHGICYFVLKRRLKFVLLYRKILIKERSVMYELLRNYKEIMHSNLKGRFQKRLGVLQNRKAAALWKIHMLENVNHILNQLLLVSVPIITGLRAITCCWHQLEEGKSIPLNFPGFHEDVSYLGIILMMAAQYYALFLMRQLYPQIETYGRHRSSRKYYDRFFNDNWVGRRCTILDDELPIGDIAIMEAEVHESETIDYQLPLKNLFNSPEQKPEQVEAVKSFDAAHQFQYNSIMKSKTELFRGKLPGKSVTEQELAALPDVVESMPSPKSQRSNVAELPKKTSLKISKFGQPKSIIKNTKTSTLPPVTEPLPSERVVLHKEATDLDAVADPNDWTKTAAEGMILSKSAGPLLKNRQASADIHFQKNEAENEIIQAHSESEDESRPVRRGGATNLRLVLSNMSLYIQSGDRVCVFHNKQTIAISGFIQMLIGENIISKGSVRYNGKVSFFSREKMPFIMGRTILDNILFGQEYDSGRFEEVLNVLQFKFDKYSGREYYQVGEKGLNLKSEDRLNLLLARFLYLQADIYVIEDLFIDIESWLMEVLLHRVVLGFLKGKTVVYVSHDTEMVEAANTVIKFKSGYKNHVSYKKKKSEKVQSARSLFVFPNVNLHSVDNLGNLQKTVSVHHNEMDSVPKQPRPNQEDIESEDSSDVDAADELVHSEGVAEEIAESLPRNQPVKKTMSVKNMSPTLEVHRGLTVVTGSNESKSRKISPQTQFQNGPFRLKNTLFLENVTYEEELEVHRRLQLKKKEIDRVITPETNILEKFSYGIFLTNKRRQEGMNLDEVDSIDYKRLLKFTVWLLFRSDDFKWIARIAVIMRTAEVILFNNVTYIMFVAIWRESREKSSISSDHLLRMLISVAIFLLLSIARSLLLSKKICFVAYKIHSKVLGSLFTSEETWVRRMKLHDILGKTNEQMQTLDLKLVKTLKEIAEALAWLFNGIIYMVAYYGFGLPLLWVSFYVCIVLFCFKKLGPAFTKITSHMYFSQYKKDDFNFQLLSLIFSHRISGTTQKLNNKFIRLTENLFKGENLMTIDFPWLIAKLLVVLRVFAVMGGLVNIFLFCRIPSLNVFKIGPLQQMWITFVGFQSLGAFETAMAGFTQFLPISLNLFRLYSFIEVSKAHIQVDSEIFSEFNSKPKKDNKVMPLADLSWRRLFDSSMSTPLIMKNVSLTLGYKVVLKKINLRVRSKERVGILGVDGGGRSAIFDLILGIKTRDNLNNSQIKLFGKPIEEILKHSLRDKIFLGARVPNLFQGTIRDNLDPYRRFSTTTLINLLVKLGLEKILTRAYLKNQSRFAEAKVTEKYSHQNSQLREALGQTGKLADSTVRKKDQSSQVASKSAHSLGITPHISVSGVATNKSGFALQVSQKKGDTDLNSHAKGADAPRQSIDSRAGAVSIDGRLTMNPSAVMGIANAVRVAEQKQRKHIIKIAPVEPDSSLANPQTNTPLAAPPVNLEQRDSVRSDKASPATGDWQLGGSVKELNRDAQGLKSVFAAKLLAKIGPGLAGKTSTRPVIPFPLDTENQSDRVLLMPESPDARVAIRPASVSSLEKGEQSVAFTKSKLAKAAQATPNLKEFLNIKVTSLGQNIDKTVRKIVSFARIILEKPALLLIYEESINWGQGIKANLDILREMSLDSAVVSITRSNGQILCYDKVLLLDGGVVVDYGSPTELIGNDSSPLYTYLKETEGKRFDELVATTRLILPRSADR